MATAFLYHPAFLEHHTGWKHPEKPQRLVAIRTQLRNSGLLDRMLEMEPAPASMDDITAIHDPGYVQALERQCSNERIFEAGRDAVASSGTFHAACLAAGAVVRAVDAVMGGSAVNAFCAVRPPGHHAERDHAMGFCFFNNVAIGARYLQRHHAIRRIAIIDWDVHHGNGTQNAFYDDPTILYVSTHQFPHYPGSGRACESGSGPGAGYTLNIPMAAGSTGTDYLLAFTQDLKPALSRFRPEFILISAGFDAHRDDPLAAMMLTESDFAAMTRSVLDMAAEHCAGRVVSVLEGGYNLRALAASVEAHLSEMILR